MHGDHIVGLVEHECLGPVASFNTCNFPISYWSRAVTLLRRWLRTRTVIAKTDHAHPGPSNIEAPAIRKAVQESGLHVGVFLMVRGIGNAISKALVDHPLVNALTFTGPESERILQNS
jgi:NADP-dependent aldehyde dehydrogenase